MIEEIKQELLAKATMVNNELGNKVFNISLAFEILDKYNNQEEYKWKCDICGTGFNNFHAQGFDKKIYCPLCYFKHEFNNYKSAFDELKKRYINGGFPNYVYERETVIQELSKKYNLGSDKDVKL